MTVIRVDPFTRITGIHFPSGCHAYFATQGVDGGGPKAPGAGDIGRLGPSNFSTGSGQYLALCGGIQDVGLFYGPARVTDGTGYVLIASCLAHNDPDPLPPDPGFPVNEGDCWADL